MTPKEDQDNHLIPMESLEFAAPVLRHVAHPVRLRILDYLRAEGTVRTVGEIREASGVSQVVISQHLRVLKDQGILTSRREGSYVLYELKDRSVLLILDCIQQHVGNRK